MNKLLNQPNELSLEVFSYLGVNPFLASVSSPRGSMLNSHLSQCITTNTSSKKRILSGLENELGRFTIGVKAPVDMTVLKVLEVYPKSMGMDSIELNPEVVVIYEDNNTKEVNVLSIPRYISNHQYFGYPLKYKPAYNKISPGATFRAGEIFADSPAVDSDGDYNFGHTLNMAFMSHPGASDDGIVICEDVLDRLKFKVYEKRSIEFGGSYYPLNVYGDKDNYKPFPDIGEVVRGDGLLMALRSYDVSSYPSDIDIYSTMEVNHIFDKPIYCRDFGGRVIDIRVTTDDVECTTTGMVNSLRKYSRGLYRYYTELVKTINDMKIAHHKKTGSPLKIGDELHRLLIEAYAYIDADIKKPSDKKLTKSYRTSVMDDYKIDFTIEYEIRPTLGFKLTTLVGGKGVICSILPRESMPRDSDGNSADIIMDNASVISRMNPGVQYEIYFGSVARDVTKDIKQMFGMDRNAVISEKDAEAMVYNCTTNAVEVAKNHYLTLYRIVSNEMYDFYSTCSHQDTLDHLVSILTEGIFLYMPVTTNIEYSVAVKQCEEAFNTIYGPVTFVGSTGKLITTKKKVRIGPTYMLLLEKISDDGSSVSSAKLAANGIITTVSKNEKFTLPIKEAAIRIIGETEGRIFASYLQSEEATAELLDRNFSPITHAEVMRSILASDTPTNIDRVVDRSVVGFNGNKALQIVKSLLSVIGVRLVRK